MIGHIKLCLEEIEAEIDAADFAVVGARARELLAEHVEGIRAVIETIAANGGARAALAEIAAQSEDTSPVLPRAA